MTSSITIYISNKGTPLTGGGESRVGHIWIGLSVNGVNTFYGFAPKDHNTPIGPGDIFTSDNIDYDSYQYSRTIPVTDEQFGRIFHFVDKNTTSFNLDYNGLTNSCVDFVWGAVNAGGLNPNNVDPDVWPGNNPDDVDKLENPLLGIGPIERPILLPSWLSPIVGMQVGNGSIFFPPGGGGMEPLILDLDGNGAHTTKLGWVEGQSTTYFDMDNDGLNAI